MKAASAILFAYCVVTHVEALVYFENGKEYVYETKSTAQAGTMDVRTYGSGVMGIWTTRLQPVNDKQLNVKFEGLKFAEFNGLKTTNVNNMYEKLQFNSQKGVDNVEFIIHYNNHGHVDKVIIPSDYSLFIKNIVKGFASQLQIDTDNVVNKNKKAFVSTENLLHGKCAVTYAVSENTVTRTVSHAEDCWDTVFRVVDDYRGRVCRPDVHIRGENMYHMHEMENMRHPRDIHAHRSHRSNQPLSIVPYPESFASTTYIMDKTEGNKPKISNIESYGSFVAQFFTENGRSQFVHSNTTSRLIEIKDAAGDINPSGEEINDLKYTFADDAFKWNVDRNLKEKEPFFSSMDEYFHSSQEEIMESLKSAIAVQANIMKNINPDDKESIAQAHKYGINTILPTFYALNYDSLLSVTNELFDARGNGKDEERQANIFAELLSSAGTSASALLVRDLILQERFPNDRDAARVLTGVPFHIRRPNVQLVNEYKKLLDFPGKRFVGMAIELTFGHMVRITCERAGKPNSAEVKECFATLGTEYVDRFVNELKATQSDEKKGMLLNVLHNIRFGGVAEKMKDIINNDQMDDWIRSTAMWTAYADVLNQGESYNYYMPILVDNNKPTEMRINALIAVMDGKPTPSQLLNVVNMLYMEKSYELVNMAYSLFQSLADSINPCHGEIKPLVNYYLKFMKQFSTYRPFYGFGVSKTYVRQFEKEKYGYGGQIRYYTVGSEASMTPLSFGMTITNTMMDSYQINDMAIHVRVEGLAKAIVRKFKKMDIDTWKTDILKQILSGDMGLRTIPDQPIRVQVSVSVKNNVVFNRYYDDKDVEIGGKIAIFLEDMRSLSGSFDLNHQRVMQVGSFLYEQPTMYGMPMALLVSTTTMFSLRARVNKGTNHGLLFADLKYELDVFSQTSQATMLPMIDATYGIVNDRIYYLRVPSSVMVGVKLLKKQLRYNIMRSPADDKIRLLMHAESTVRVRGNNVRGEYEGLKKSCPVCENSVVVTKNDNPEGRVIVDSQWEAVGTALKAEYFDCDMDISKANTWSHGLGAFMPYNKQPKTLVNSFMMGIRQIRTFFFLFPRTEKCGLAISYGKSNQNGLSEIHVQLRGGSEANGKRMFFRGKNYNVKMFLKLVFDNSEEKNFRFTLNYNYSPGNLKNNLVLKMESRVKGNNDTICVNMENKYPPFTPEFLTYDEDSEMKVKGNLNIKYGGTDCSRGKINVDFQHSTTEEAREMLKNKWFYNECMKRRLSDEWSNALSYPMTEDCYMLLHDATTARKYSWNISFDKLTDRMKLIISKVRVAIEAGLMPYWDFETEPHLAAADIGPFLNIEAVFHNNEKNLDLKLTTRQGTEEIKDISLSMPFWPKLMRNLKFTGTIKRLYDLGLISPCIFSGQSIRTNDNVTYTYQAPDCWTMYSAHCNDNPTYAVFARKSASSGAALDAKVYIGGHEVELLGDKSVKVDGKAVQINEDEGYDTEVFNIFRWGSTYNIYSYLKVWITYDGNAMEVMPAPSVKGQHCGMCGNYNRNKFDEFKTEDMTELTTPQEMMEHYKWKC